MPGPETRARRKLVHALKDRGFVIFTIHGGAFSSGIPDLLGGIPRTGRLIGIEMKARRFKDLRTAKEPLEGPQGPAGTLEGRSPIGFYRGDPIYPAMPGELPPGADMIFGPSRVQAEIYGSKIIDMSNSHSKAGHNPKSRPDHPGRKGKQDQSVDLDDRLSRLARRGYPPVSGEDVGSMREAARPGPGQGEGAQREGARGRQGAGSEHGRDMNPGREALKSMGRDAGLDMRGDKKRGVRLGARRASSDGPKPPPTALQLEALKDIDEVGGLALVVVYEIDEGRRTRFRIWKLTANKFSLYMTVRKAEDVADIISRIP